MGKFKTNIMWPFDTKRKKKEREDSWREYIKYKNECEDIERESKQKAYELFVAPLKRAANPCPFCGSSDIDFKYTVSYGHGDSGFSGSCECLKCGAKKGNVHNYGRPENKDIIDAFNQWNDRQS